MQAQLTVGFSVVLNTSWHPGEWGEGQILGDHINVWVCVGKEGGRKEEEGGGILGDCMRVYECEREEEEGR